MSVTAQPCGLIAEQGSEPAPKNAARESVSKLLHAFHGYSLQYGLYLRRDTVAACNSHGIKHARTNRANYTMTEHPLCPVGMRCGV